MQITTGNSWPINFRLTLIMPAKFITICQKQNATLLNTLILYYYLKSTVKFQAEIIAVYLI